MKTIAYQSKEEQDERYNNMLISRLGQYVAVQQQDWDIYLQPLTYVYNAWVPQSMNPTPFSLFLSRHSLYLQLLTSEQADGSTYWCDRDIIPAHIESNTLISSNASVTR